MTGSPIPSGADRRVQWHPYEMDGWTETSKKIGQERAQDILRGLVELRGHSDTISPIEEFEATNCRYLIENAAEVEPLATIAALSTLAESMLFRLAQNAERVESDVLEELLSTTHMRVTPAAPKKRSRSRRP